MFLTTSLLVLLTSLRFALVANAATLLRPRADLSVSGQASLFKSKAGLAESIKGAMLGSIRTRSAHAQRLVLYLAYACPVQLGARNSRVWHTRD